MHIKNKCNSNIVVISEDEQLQNIQFYSEQLTCRFSIGS